MIKYYEKLKDTILKDVDAKLSGPMSERNAEKIKKELDIASDCEQMINKYEEDEYDQLSAKALEEIDKIVKRDLDAQTKKIQNKD